MQVVNLKADRAQIVKAIERHASFIDQRIEHPGDMGHGVAHHLEEIRALNQILGPVSAAGDPVAVRASDYVPRDLRAETKAFRESRNS